MKRRPSFELESVSMRQTHRTLRPESCSLFAVATACREAGKEEMVMMCVYCIFVLVETRLSIHLSPSSPIFRETVPAGYQRSEQESESRAINPAASIAPHHSHPSANSHHDDSMHQLSFCWSRMGRSSSSPPTTHSHRLDHSKTLCTQKDITVNEQSLFDRHAFAERAQGESVSYRDV